MNELLELVRENNKMLKEILDIMREISSKEHIQKEDMKSFAINLLADIMVEYKSEELNKLVKNINL